MIAEKVVESGREWAKQRKEGLRIAAGAEGIGSMGKKEMERIREKERVAERQRTEMEMTEEGDEEEDEDEEEEEEEEEEEDVDADDVDDVNGPAVTKREGENIQRDRKKRKVGSEMDEMPLGAYEPHSGVVHCQCLSSPCNVVLTSERRSHRHPTNTKSMGGGARFRGEKKCFGRNEDGEWRVGACVG
jgi:hypothetical protein